MKKFTLLLQMFLLCGLLAGAQPVVSSLSTYTGIPGSSVVITGSGFNTTPVNNVVLFGAAKATVTTASATSLTVTVPYGNSLGTVSVNNTATGLTGYSGKAFMSTFSAGPYSPGLKYGTQSMSRGGDALRAATGDLNGDGYPEAVNYGTFGALHINTNISTPGIIKFVYTVSQPDETTITLPVPSSSINFSKNVLVADVNGDNKQDIIITHTDGIYIYMNNYTSGSLSTSNFATRVLIAYTGAKYVTIGDLDADGKPELIVGGNGSIAVFKNQSITSTITTGSFASPVTFSSSNVFALAVGDIDLDGKPDLVVNGSSTQIFRNTCTAGVIDASTFASPVTLATGVSADLFSSMTTTIADIDGDSKPDIAMVIGSFIVYKNNTTPGTITSGSFASTTFATGSLPLSLAAADFDGDNKIDIVVGCYYWDSEPSNVFFLKNTATSGVINSSTFAAAEPIGYGQQIVESAVSADFDLDGRPDLWLNSYNSSTNFLVRNQFAPPGISSVSSMFAVPGSSITISGSNFNTTPDSNVVTFGAVRGTVTSASHTSLTVTVPTGATFKELLVTNKATWQTGTYNLAAYLPKFDNSATAPGVPNFNSKIDFTSVDTNSQNVVVRDLDMDGKPDILSVGKYGISVYRNTSTSGSITSGSFASPVLYGVSGYGGYEHNTVKTGDIDGDGKPEIIIGYGSESIGVLHNLTTPGTINSSSFASGTTLSLWWVVPNYFVLSDVIDIDGDGKLDILAETHSPGTYYSSVVYCFHNTSKVGEIDMYSFNFNIPTVMRRFQYQHINANMFFDISGDNKPELVYNVRGTDSICVMKNVTKYRVSGEITPEGYSALVPMLLPDIKFLASSFADSVTQLLNADIDGDGKRDIIAVTTDGISIMRNMTSGATMSFATAVEYPYIIANKVSIADMNGDGKPDLIYSSATDSVVLVMINKATSGAITAASFDAPIPFRASYYGQDVVACDFDGDNKPDIAVGYTGFAGHASTVSILRKDILAGSGINGNANVCVSNTTTFSHDTTGGTWSSSNTSIATVGTTGIVTGVVAGTATISYTFASSAVRTRIVSVNAGPASIVGSPTVCQSSTDFQYNSVPGGIWSSSNTSVTTIGSGTGLAAGNVAGTTTISYVVCGATTTRTMTVLPTTITVNAIVGASTMCLTNILTYTNATPGGVWSSTGVNLNITQAGVITATQVGTAVITYTINNGCTSAMATKTVTVSTATPAGTLSGATTTCIGGTTTFASTTSGGTWSSTNTSVATIGSSTGIITGVSLGTSIITYAKDNACGYTYSTRTVTVNTTVPAGSINGYDWICGSGTRTLTNSVTGGVWSSSDPSVATIDATGIVTTVSPGTTTISYTVTGGTCLVLSTKVFSVYATSAGTITGTATLCVSGTTTLSNTVPTGVWSSGSTSVATVDASGIVTGVSSGTATITYNISNFCGTVRATKVVTVDAPSALPEITGTFTVCTTCTQPLSGSPAGGTWSSSNPSNATVGTSGIVSGVAVGTTVITYTTSNSCGSAYDVATVTVVDDGGSGTITGTGSVGAGGTITLTDTVSGGTWSSGDSSIATVDSTGTVTGVSSGTVTISYTVIGPYGTSVSTFVVTVGCATSAGSITGTAIVCAGATTTLSNATSGGTWSSGATGIATIGSSGIVTGVSAGTATISYSVTDTCGSATVTQVVTVNAATNAGTISGASSVDIAAIITLTPSVSGGTWSASNSNATVVGTSGVVTGVTAGTVIISYSVTGSCGTAFATHVVTVNGSGPLGAITGTLSACSGGTTTLSNTASGGSWSSANPSIANVGPATGVVTGVSPGTVDITYSLGGSVVKAEVTINPLPASISGATGVCLEATTTFASTTSGGTWSSSSTSVATVGSTSGDVTGVASGTATIYYTLATGCQRSQTVNVYAPPSAITGTASVCEGSNTTLSNSTPVGVSWTSDNTSVATVSAGGGLVTGVATGTATITYTINTGCYTTREVTVTALPATISGTPFTCAGGGTTTLSTTPTGGTWTTSNTAVATIASTGVMTGVSAGYINVTYTLGSGCRTIAVATVGYMPAVITGTPIMCIGATANLSSATGGCTWSSDDGATATISTGGVVTGVDAGTTTISYTHPLGCARTVVATVTVAPPASTGITTLCIGSTTTLSNTATGGVWTSSNTSKATVNSSTGLVTGVSAGTANISYSVGGGCYNVTLITVSSSLANISGATVTCIGLTTTFTHPISGGTWSSSDASIASVDATTGVITGVSGGTATITYSIGSGCFKTKSITISSGSGGITGNTTVCIGSTSVLSCPTGGGTSWTSSTPSVATIGVTSGVVTGIAAGTTEITYLVGSGCSSTTIVTVESLPTAISGTMNVCRFATTTLSSVGTTGGTWTSSVTAKATVGSASGIVSGINAGTSMITYTWTNTCQQTAMVTVDPLPTPGVVQCLGSTIVHTGSSPERRLTATGGEGGGTWTSSNPAIAMISVTASNVCTVTAVSAGAVNITYTVTNGCGTTFSQRNLTIISPRPGETITTENSAIISVYPNPTSGQVTIEAPISGTFAVYTIDGREVSKYTISGPTTKLSLPNTLASGIYMCRFSGEDGSTTMVRLVYER